MAIFRRLETDQLSPVTRKVYKGSLEATVNFAKGRFGKVTKSERLRNRVSQLQALDFYFTHVSGSLTVKSVFGIDNAE